LKVHRPGFRHPPARSNGAVQAGVDRDAGIASALDSALASVEALRRDGFQTAEVAAEPSEPAGVWMIGGYLWYRAVTVRRARRFARRVGYLTVSSRALGGEIVVRYSRADWRAARFREWRDAQSSPDSSFPELRPTRSFEDDQLS
jgi:hypothetical protein